MAAPPWANWAIILLTLLCYSQIGGADGWNRRELPSLALHDPGIGIVGHVLVHADIGHLLGNLLFLWVFGNAVAPRLGLIAYPIFYFGSGALLGVIHLVTSDMPLVGASGAICAVVGMFFVLHPQDPVTLLFGSSRAIQLPGWCAVLCWVAFDLWGLSTVTDVAHATHLLGYLIGFVTAVVLIRTNSIPVADFETTFLDLRIGRWLRG